MLKGQLMYQKAWCLPAPCVANIGVICSELHFGQQPLTPSWTHWANALLWPHVFLPSLYNPSKQEDRAAKGSWEGGKVARKRQEEKGEK